MKRKWSKISFENCSADRFWPIIAVIVTIVVFIPSINYDFLMEWDDCHYVNSKYLEISLSNIRHCLTGLTLRLYTPVTSLSLMIDYALFGNCAPTGYRVHNILLHCGSVLLFIGIMRQLRISPLIAAGVALLWAIHPQRISSVVWISERKDALAVFFALAAMYTYITLFIDGKTREAFSAFIILEKLARSGKLRFYFNNDYARTFWGALASCYIRSKQPEKALSCLKSQLCVLEPESFYALTNQGLTAFIRRDFASAESYWKKALILRPHSKKIIYNIEILRKMQNQEKK